MKIIEYTEKYKDKTIELIDTVYHEYEDRMYLQGFDKDLLNIREVYIKKGGMFWVITDNTDEIIGSLAIKPPEGNIAEFKRFYIKKEYRGNGYSVKLFQLAIEWCERKGIENVFFWSDVRFTRSHSFYKKLGINKGKIRHMNDGAMPYSEYLFECHIDKIKLNAL